MRAIFFIAFITVTQYCVAQENQYNAPQKLSSEDSVCIKKAAAMIRQVKQAGENGKYDLSEDLLTVMTPTDSTGKEITIRILNLGEPKNIEVEVVELNWQGTDDQGHTAGIHINNTLKIPLPPDYILPTCNSMSFKQKPLTVNNINFTRISYLKLSVYYDGKEKVIELGKQ